MTATEAQAKPKSQFQIGDTIRMPHYSTKPNEFRVWKICGHYLGCLGQEGVYWLKEIDLKENGNAIHVPCIMLETHPLIERV